LKPIANPVPTTLTLCAVLCGLAAFLTALLFYGAQVNLLMLACTATLLAAALAMRGLSQRLALRELLWILVAVFAIAAAQLRSLSPDSSFAAAWVLGLVPLAYLYGRSLGTHLDLLFYAIAAVVTALAVNSAWGLVLYDERPGVPLSDYNNYAALLYVVLLPIAHRTLARGWAQRFDAPWFAGLGGVGLLCMVIAGTGSRAALLILAGAALVWLLVTIVQRRSPIPLLLVAGSGCLGIIVCEWLIYADVATAPGAETVAGGMAVRWTLIEAAIDMFAERPLTGIGIFVFPLLYRQVRGPADDDSAGLFVHNDYVQLLVEGGPFLLVTLFPLGVMVLAKIRASLSVSKEEAGAGSLGFALALGARLAHALVNFVFYTAVLSVMAGLLAARLRLDDTADAPALDGATMRRVVFAPVLLLGFCALALLWLDVVSASILQGQPGTALTRAIGADPDRQARYATFAQQVNPRRGVPFLATAAIADRRLTPANGPDATAAVLERYRRALEVDPWNTNAWWMFRDFLLRHPGLRSLLDASESPPAITRKVLTLDPLFVPAIEARLQELAPGEASTRRQRQLTFLATHLGSRLTWMARQDGEAALHYLETLEKYAASDAEKARWRVVRQDVESVQPLTPERWFF
jgi:O-antigen ligase